MYSLLLPPDYQRPLDYPLLISLHGAGEKGDRMVRYWKESAAHHNVILCCPNSSGASWAQPDMLRMIQITEHVLKNYSVDRKRILLSGISAGGAVTYLLGFTIPVLYPYLNPMSAAFGDSYLKLLKDAEKRPLYITHGAKDDLISPAEGGALAAKVLKENGFDVSYVERPNDGHQVPEGEQENILNWFEHECAKEAAKGP